MQPYDRSMEDFLDAVCGQVRFKTVHSSIKDELSDHIACLKDEYISEGMDAENASLKALQQMGDPVLIGRQLNQAHSPKIEWSILALVLVLTGIGGFVQFFLSAVSPNNAQAFSNFLIYAPLGIAAFVFTYFFDYMLIGRYSKLVYFSLMAAAILGFFILARIHGAYRHIYYYALLFMPAFSGVIYGLRNKGYFGIIISGIFYTGGAIMCLLAPTFSGLLFLTIGCLVILTSAINRGYFGGSKRAGLAIVYIPTLAVTVACISALYGPLARRFSFMMHPEADPNGYGYQHLMVKRLISSSRPLGKAVLDGDMAGMDIHRLLPGWQTDFTLTYVFSSLGYIAGLAIIAVMLLLIIRMFGVAAKQKNAFGFLLSLSCCIAITGQIVFYVLSNTGVIVMDGILPFVSYGGTGFTVNMMLTGLLLSAYRRTNLVKDVLKSGACSSQIFTLADGKLIIDLGIKKQK
ncbi:FtsW/RodA/SpoVE family cell cycle protein [Lutispora saccharofermentans]|uniref:FtsW/RodA/SpoVE family cell cycle protein n=1 Tax=Lutispora saccharofermentans TaxID=3024236 RepID=A0ABT1NCL0_9FIRM|nr:FtsW/RodA/SpoVE family cell cycle protein [Lutispora saccharofermentans]MCQ1529000.1 FtsW/RodA/SpoVE family cell cycle protein [Lutispora saccharofermentans]